MSETCCFLFLLIFLGEMEEGLEGARGEIVKNGFLGGFVDVLGRFEVYRLDGFLMEKTLQAVTMLIDQRLGTDDKSVMEKLQNVIQRLKKDHPDLMEQESWQHLEKSIDSLLS